MPPKHTGPNSPVRRWAFAAAAAIGCIGLAWWFTQPPTRLDEDRYATALALYRACNQRSEVGLDQIETHLEEPALHLAGDDAALAAIRAIIRDARQSRWQQATEDCRDLLDSQVQR